MKPKLILIMILLTAYFQLLTGTTRYVSKTGSSTPPYTSWATASDSIQKCINYSIAGDTIYVANGVYKEMVRVYPGKTLIGAGWDSCVIDTRDLIDDPQDNALVVDDNTNVEGFLILTSNGQVGTGIYINRAIAAIRHMKIKYAGKAIYMFNSSPVVSDNIIENCERGIQMQAFTNNYFPQIYNNHIYYPKSYGIVKTFGNCPKIYNNVIFLNNEFNRGIFLGDTDSIFVYNNLIISQNAQEGIGNPATYTLNYNNYVEGNYSEAAIWVGDNNIIKNNIITNGNVGIRRVHGMPIISYNNSWNNNINYYNFLPHSTNISVNPMVVNKDSLDFHLQKYSPAIDAGDPNILDVDGSRSDIGLFGGPYGQIYTYHDLAPKPPRNLTAFVQGKAVTLKWNKNTEADLFRYRVYRDTVPNFIYDTTKIIGVTADTFFVDMLGKKQEANNYYYKLTAIDSAINQSAASEEVQVTVTGMAEVPPIVVEEYKLLQNYPNPFNPSTTIPYRLKSPGYVKIMVYNVLGELVRVLVNHHQSAGYYELDFTPNSKETTKGREAIREFETFYYGDIVSGIYLYRIEVIGEGNIPVFTDMKKMMMVK
jgi:hypothetical protein